MNDSVTIPNQAKSRPSPAQCASAARSGSGSLTGACRRWSVDELQGDAEPRCVSVFLPAEESLCGGSVSLFKPTRVHYCDRLPRCRSRRSHAEASMQLFLVRFVCVSLPCFHVVLSHDGNEFLLFITTNSSCLRFNLVGFNQEGFLQYKCMKI